MFHNIRLFDGSLARHNVPRGIKHLFPAYRTNALLVGTTVTVLGFILRYGLLTVLALPLVGLKPVLGGARPTQQLILPNLARALLDTCAARGKGIGGSKFR